MSTPIPDESSAFLPSPTRSGEQEVRSADDRFTQFTDIPSRGFNRLVRARRYGRWWVLKGLKDEFRTQTFYQAQLRKEFDITVTLQHEGIAAVSSLEEVVGVPPEGTAESIEGKTAPWLCIVMEWIDGETLTDWLARRPSRARRRRVFEQILAAVSYAHSRQVVHRDLKPSNILITRNGERVKLIDFGLGDTDSHAILKQPAGTPSYISPEQLSASSTDVRNDIYSLGHLLRQLRLGLATRPVVRHCLRPLARRYPDVAALRRALHRSRTRLYIIGVLVVALLIALLAVVAPQPSLKGEGAQTPQDAAAEGASSTTVEGNSNETSNGTSNGTSSGNANGTSSAPSAQSSEEEVRTAVKQFIADGKRRADRHFAVYAMDARLDTLTRRDYIEPYYLRIVEEMNTFAHDYAVRAVATSSLLRRLPDDDRAAHRVTIENTLLLYLNERYISPWAKIIGSK